MDVNRIEPQYTIEPHMSIVPERRENAAAPSNAENWQETDWRRVDFDETDWLNTSSAVSFIRTKAMEHARKGNREMAGELNRMADQLAITRKKVQARVQTAAVLRRAAGV